MLPGRSSAYPLILLSSIHKRRYIRSGNPRFNKIPGELLCVVTQGKGLLRINHEVFTLQTGAFFLLQPSMKVEAVLESSHADCYILLLNRVTFSRQRGSWSVVRTGESGPLLPPGKLHLKSTRAALDSAHQVYANSRDRAKRAEELQIHFQGLLRTILDNLTEEGGREEANRGIESSIQYMAEHFRGKIKLDTLSRLAGLTQTSYSRSFKKLKGISPVEYLNRIRIDYSKQLLNQECSIKEASELAGFGNPFYFSRMFKREQGISPTLYMQRRQLRAAVATCFGYHNNLISLGMDAVAGMNGFNYTGQGEDEHKKFVQEQLNTLREARPDLILADYRHIPFSAQLKQIAPTVFLELTFDWRKNHRRIAELVGREKEAQLNLTQLDQKISWARQLLAGRFEHETVSVGRLYTDKLRVQGTAGHPLNELLYGELGLTPGSGVPLSELNTQYPLDRLAPFETDHLFLYKHFPSQQEEALFSQLRQNASWCGMQASRTNRIRFIDNWILLSWTPIGQNQIVDELLLDNQR